MSNFWTSDFHLGDSRILELRNFSNDEENYNTIKDIVNSTVTKNDTVYHIGDYCFDDKYLELIYELNGTWIFLKGNHDIIFPKTSERKSIVISGFNFEMTHDPDNLTNTSSRNLVGHVHNDWKYDTRYVTRSSGRIFPIHMLNVGIDAWDFNLVTESNIKDIFKISNSKANSVISKLNQ